MIYLLLAILSSAMVSIMMRISESRISAKTGMLSVNYFICLCVAGVYAVSAGLPAAGGGFAFAAGFGAFSGFLYLMGFVMLQLNVRKNGVVFSAIFMKLGLLLPIVMSIFLFGEMPDALQTAGFILAVAAMVFIQSDKQQSAVTFKPGLILLFLVGGAADATSKIYEQYGEPACSGLFLFFVFVSAFLLSLIPVIKNREKIGKAELLYGALVGIPNYFSSRFLLQALENVPAVIAYPTYSVAAIAVVTMAGVLVFGERLGKKQWGAVGAIMVSLVLLNI